MQSLTLSKSIEGFNLAAAARRLSPDTIKEYNNTFRKFQAFLEGDLIIADITPNHVRAFLAGQDKVSKKTLLNYHIGLSALWTWALEEGLVEQHVLHKVHRPRPEMRAVIPYTRDEIKAMLGALERSRTYKRPGKRETDHRLKYALRNQAIILLLLDTGIRSSELCNANLADLDLRVRRLRVMGKGSKERLVRFSARTGRAIWRYLALENRQSGPLFSANNRRMNRDELLKTIRRISLRANVSEANVHRFRHTFAIEYLRNGGRPWHLQQTLGHSTMSMVKHYLALSQVDIDQDHQIASPVEHFNL